MVKRGLLNCSNYDGALFENTRKEKEGSSPQFNDMFQSSRNVERFVTGIEINAVILEKCNYAH